MCDKELKERKVRIDSINVSRTSERRGSPVRNS